MDEELIDEFNTTTEAGEIVRLYVYEQIVDAGSFDDPSASLRGLKRIETEDGDLVNYVDDRTYQRVSTGEALKRAGKP